MRHLALWFLLSAAAPALALPPRLPASPPPKAAEDAVTGETSAWQATLERAVPAVVSLRVTAVRDFDTESAGISQGTGFIVDVERGLILTNRHMVHAGPVLAEAVLLNNEEIELQAIYRDPVHDFGFYRFDPAAVRHMDLTELTLDPAAAFVGQEIRVIGNDAGEKISILDGTLARLDRNAPVYGRNTYNDFNTFYFQAASNTSGGSSGSPVLDVKGRVVALNAGGRPGAASSFYLPLDRVVRAFERVQAGLPVPRGTLQTVFLHTHFDELRRLGLRPDTEAVARVAPGHGSGMLVVSEVVPGGPGHDKLAVGDVLVRVNGTLITEFVPLEALLDEAVGQPLVVEVERGGAPLTLELTVGDLHAISPDTYLEIGRGILQPLSYHQARNHNRAVKGVYLAVPGYMFAAGEVPGGTVITHVDGVEIPDLDAMQRELEGKAHGQRVRVRFNGVNDHRQSYESVVVIDRVWYTMQRCRLDAATGDWPCTQSPTVDNGWAERPASELLRITGKNNVEKAVADALVMVDFDIPHPTSGVKDFNYVGVGTVVDAEQGLVLVDRDTVPVALGDMMLTFAGSVRVPGRLRYLHPTHNFGLVQYDPALLGDLSVKAVRWAPGRPSVGDKVWHVGLNREHEVVSKETEVSAYDALHLGVSGTPRFRDANVEGIDLKEAEPSLGGVVVDKRGRVHALWASFLDQRDSERAFHGLPREFIDPVLQPLLRGEEPVYRVPGFEVSPLNLAVARDRGLSDARIRQLLQHDPSNRYVLEVRRIHGGSHAAEVLRHTDLLLEIDGKPVTRMREIEALHDKERLRLVVLRDGKERVFEVDTMALDGSGTDRVVSWAGMILHEPHYEVDAQQAAASRAQGDARATSRGVYVAWLWFGSPAHRYDVRPTRRIVQIDDTPTPDLETLLEVVRTKGDREAVRLTVEALDGAILVHTLKLDARYWPTQIFEHEDGRWTRSEPVTTTADLRP